MFVTHLKKELRQGAPTLAALSALVLVAAPGFTAVYFLLLHPDWSFDAADFAWRIAAVAAAAALLALGDAAVPESREGNAALLARLPGALGPSFLARSIVLVVGTVLTTAFAFAVTAGACAAIGERLWFGTSWPGLLAGGGRVVGMAALGALWTLALVSGVRRGGLAFPAAALVAGLAVVPTWWALRAAGVWPKTGDTPFAIGVLAVAAALAAWIAFRGTFRWSRGPTAGAWRGVAALLVLTAPIPALGALRHHQWTTVEVGEDLHVRGALIGTGARRLFLIATRPWSGFRDQPLSLLVDVETGTMERVDGVFLPAASAVDRARFSRRPQPIVLVARSASDWRFLDAVTGETVHRSPGPIDWRGLPAGFRARLADAVRRTAPTLLPDGRPAWIAERELRALEPDGTTSTVPLPPAIVPHSSSGAWVLGLGHRLLNLATRQVLESTRATGRIVSGSDDGVLWRRSRTGEASEGPYVWVSSIDGSERTVTREEGTAEGTPADGYLGGPALRARGGRIVLYSDDGDFLEFSSALFDPRSATVRGLGPWTSQVLAVDDDGSVFARSLDGRRIFRFDPDTEEVEILFPPGP